MSAPSGAVTFLFTDIEGSTRLWETQHDAMQTSLARHDALLRQSIAAYGGHVVKTLGDGFHAAFATASDAVQAALAAQQALHAESWPEPVQIRVRMAVHTGAAELREGDYYGPAMNRVARLVAIGHGGQTLLSAAAHDLCCDHLPPAVSLKPLGEYNLKGLARREAVFQLCHPELPQDFPALRTLLAPIDEDTPSIAVLPFVNMSGDEENEYFADGLAEELLNVLSKIHGLRVASRTSAFSFKGTTVDIPTVAQKLNVATILEGSVRKVGKRVRITAQLVQVVTDSHLWSQTYDRTLEDIFAIQDDIAQSVVKELRTTLLGEAADAKADNEVIAAVAAAVKGRSTNPQAHRLFLQARHFIDRLAREDTTKGIGHLKEALALEPRFALAWAELGRAYATEADWGPVPVVEGYGRAREAVARALALEPDLAEGHAGMGYLQMVHDWDWRGAAASYRRALELAPGNALVLQRASMLAGLMGRFEEAISLQRRAVEQNPLSADAYFRLGTALFIADRLAEAVAALRMALELAPQRGVTSFCLSNALRLQGCVEGAMAEALREPNAVLRLLALAIIHHAAGRRVEADAALKELTEKHANKCAYQVAQAYAARGASDLAFEWLERAYAERDPGLSWTMVDPLLRSLHADSRWDPFLRKMGFTDEAKSRC